MGFRKRLLIFVFIGYAEEIVLLLLLPDYSHPFILPALNLLWLAQVTLSPLILALIILSIPRVYKRSLPSKYIMEAGKLFLVGEEVEKEKYEDFLKEEKHKHEGRITAYSVILGTLFVALVAASSVYWYLLGVVGIVVLILLVQEYFKSLEASIALKRYYDFPPNDIYKKLVEDKVILGQVKEYLEKAPLDKAMGWMTPANVDIKTAIDTGKDFEILKFIDLVEMRQHFPQIDPILYIRFCVNLYPHLRYPYIVKNGDEWGVLRHQLPPEKCSYNILLKEGDKFFLIKPAE